MVAQAYVRIPSGRISCAVSLAVMAIMAVLSGCASGPASNARDEQQIDLTVQFEGFTAEEIMAAGDAAFELGDYERAEFIYTRVVDLEDSPESWLKLGKTLVYLGKPAYAGRAYENVLERDPDNAVAHEELGLLYIGAREVAQARKYLRRAIELDETRWPAHNALGVLADTQRNYSTAIEHYRLALTHNPRSAMLLTNLGYSNYLIGDLDRAEDLYRSAIGMDASYKRAFANLGLISARRGNYDDAVIILRKVTEQRQAYNDVGYLAYQNGDLDAAAWLLSEAIRISPSYYATAYENLDKVHRESKRRGQTQDDTQIIGTRDQIRLRADHVPEIRRVDAVTLNVRRSGNTDAQVVAHLRPNESVEVLFDNGAWAFVGYGDGPAETRGTGWVRSRYLIAEPAIPVWE